MKFTKKVFGVLATMVSIAILCAAQTPTAQAAPGQAWLEVITPLARVTVGEEVVVSTHVSKQNTTGHSLVTPPAGSWLLSDLSPKEFEAVKNKPSPSTPPKSPGTSGRTSIPDPQASKRVSTSSSSGATNTKAVNSSSIPAAWGTQATTTGQTVYDRRLIDAINANTHLGATGASTPRRSSWILLALPVALLAHAIWKAAKLHKPKSLL